MAKRSRGSARPGQRRPTHRPSRPSAAPASQPRRSDGLTEAEMARAAELEAQLVEEERAAEDARRRTRDRGRNRNDEPAPRSREAAMIGARAAEEYAYVVRDVRRIAAVGGGLLAVLGVLYVAIEVLELVRI